MAKFKKDIQVAKVRSSDLLEPGSPEFRIGDKTTTVGYLREKFLYGGPDIIETGYSQTKYDDYELAVSLFKEANNIAKGVNLLDWEDNRKNSRTKQARAINKFIDYLEELKNQNPSSNIK